MIGKGEERNLKIRTYTVYDIHPSQYAYNRESSSFFVTQELRGRNNSSSAKKNVTEFVTRRITSKKIKFSHILKKIRDVTLPFARRHASRPYPAGARSGSATNGPLKI